MPSSPASVLPPGEATALRTSAGWRARSSSAVPTAVSTNPVQDDLGAIGPTNGAQRTLEPHVSVESVVGTTALSPPDPSVLRPVQDDRDEIVPGDRLLLVVEDDVAFARILLTMAHENGYKAIVATRGDSGLALANQFKPDAITLDLQLPDGNGLNVLHCMPPKAVRTRLIARGRQSRAPRPTRRSSASG